MNFLGTHIRPLGIWSITIQTILVPAGQIQEQAMHLKALVRATGQVGGLVLEAHAEMLVATGQHQGQALYVKTAVVPATGQVYGQGHR